MNKTQINKTPPCRFIKSKNSFGMLEGSDSWSGVEDPNATYWCSKSAGPVGPDNGEVGPKSCTKGRECFTPI